MRRTRLLLSSAKALIWERVRSTRIHERYYRLTKREEKRLRLEEAEGDYGLTPDSEVGSGKPHDP